MVCSTALENCYPNKYDFQIVALMAKTLRDSFFPEWTKQYLGEYSTWRTPISDQFSSLSDEEVCVLFCFLCSDSGIPDFTDTDCLDILNGIREVIYDENSVTSEEAQRTLDGLKSRGFLWNWDGVDITEDTKDETMYRVTERDIKCNIELIERVIRLAVYWLSSYTTVVRYLRSHRYTRKSGEKCVICNYSDCDSVLIHRLQMNILTHVTMEDTDICDEVSRILNIPLNKVRMSEGERRAFLEELQQTVECEQIRGGSQGSVQHVKWLWRYERTDFVRSCIGPHPHSDIYIINNTAYRKHSQYHDRPPAERCLLYCLLMVGDYTVKVKDESHITMYNAIRERYFTELPVCEKITAADTPEEIIHVENDVIKFKPSDIRHDVMYAFITECLVEDSDLKFFLTTASPHVISEYCRSWDYKRSEGERCLYIPARPDEMYDLFIDRLQLDILTHCTVSDWRIHYSISKRLRIPIEVMSWSDEARRRFVDNFRKGSIEMFRARGMIVGCAGAGKTTILKRLQRNQTEDLNTNTKTTIGLEVHNDIFEIVSDNLEDFKQNSKSGKDDNTASLHENKQLISMTDFAGQVAYYACHQIYLSRRAFYLLVIDMSKNLKDIAYDPERHNPIGSLFEKWTYENYFVFWLQSIKTYCDDKKMKEKFGEDVGANPVILIASHRDQLETENVRKHKNPVNRSMIEYPFYEELEKCLPKEQILGGLISPERYFEVECPPGDLSEEQEDIIDKVRKCVVQAAMGLPHWGEKIPIQWSYFEQILHEEKEEKILKRKDLWKMDVIQFKNEDDMDDMLRFYQEIGQIIYFSDEGLRDVIILDVQWFVDAFKAIITDPTHVHGFTQKVKEWKAFRDTGKLSDATLCKIWKKNYGESYIKHKKEIMVYMEKLGILAEVESQDETPFYYIPSINKRDLKEEDKEIIDAGNKTPLFIFYFRNYLPHFFFYRLFVNCFRKWNQLGDDLFFKNAAFFKVKDEDHRIAIAVSKTSIQLQVFTPEENIELKEEETKGIRSAVEDLINEITTTFHEKVNCKMGFACKDLNITDEDEDMFLPEEDVACLKTSSRPCPIHLKKVERHRIDRDNLLKYWYTGANPSTPQREST
ncbi:uncharacterized protein LOC130046575 isoform X2 [Ostrea edulis]|uniref:uncharacterized protein LOC130046575 isoform X2 n=1 Tax=Ostrea edulis TaxID=37623 RepID=UPI0024AEAFC8|nr:uncharacterized protein LOC130046575 isoform X2 [Ostrea edulis]